MHQSPKFSAAEWIQISYPSEPDWSSISEEVLVELVEAHCSEQSCATIAIGLLATRGHPRAEALARWLLNEPEADKWLKKSAYDVLNRGRDEA